MGDQTQAYDIFQTPLSSGYPLPLSVRKKPLYESLSSERLYPNPPERNAVSSTDFFYSVVDPDTFI